MSDLALEPVACRQRWTMPATLQPAEWTALFAQYLDRLARACDAAGQESATPVVIGHIKLLALFPGQAYLRISAVRAGDPPTVSGAAPGGLTRVDTTLNALVYGLPAATLAAQIALNAATLAQRRGGAVEEIPIHTGEQDAH